MPLDTDIAWCAGFFDGEGHVSYHRGYPSRISGCVSPQLYAAVSQCSDNVEVLEFFQRIVGFGKLKGPYKMPNGRPQHRLLFGKDEIEPLFFTLQPYLREEKTQDFRHALMGYWSHDSTPTPEDYARLNKRDEKKYKNPDKETE